MRFCISGKQSFPVIKKADEIKFQYIDKDRIFDLIEDYSDKTIILDVPGEESDWTNWSMYDDSFSEFYIALHKLHRAAEFNSKNIKWYWPYQITTFYELKMIINLRPSYLLIGPPLTFDLDKVRENACGIPLRMVANNAQPAYVPQVEENGICGQWIRPEDCDLYADYIRCIEFEGIDSLKEEIVILNAYQKREWPGNLKFIIKGLNYDIDNRVIPTELIKKRMNCGMRCHCSGKCRSCKIEFRFANIVKHLPVDQLKVIPIDNN